MILRMKQVSGEIANIPISCIDSRLQLSDLSQFFFVSVICVSSATNTPRCKQECQICRAPAGYRAG